MFQKFAHGASTEAKSGKKKEIGITSLDDVSMRMLNIPKDKDRIKSEEDKALLKFICDEYDLSDFTPMNALHGPHSGISRGERLLRSYRLGLLKMKTINSEP